MKNIFIFLLISAISVTGKAQTNSKINQSLADSLAKWAAVDQTAMRPQPKTGLRSGLTRQQWRAYQDSVTNTNQKRVEAVFDQYGFPGYDLVGTSGSTHFWLMMQHFDKYPEFQVKVLAAMKNQVNRKNANPENFAYLQDDVLLNTGHKQLYATQVTYNTKNGQAYPKPVADSLNVDNRRKEVGLEPLRIYLNDLTRAHFLMNDDFFKQAGIKEPTLYEVGK
ncbi:MAG: DUF6624 domain-containing protein [Bacteroidota bacterium]